MEEREDREPLLDGVGGLPEGSLRPPDVPPGLESAVLRKTVSVVRWRRRRRQLGNVAFLGVVYLAGLGTALLLEDPAPRPEGLTRNDVREPATVRPEEASSPEEILRRVPGAPPAEQRRLLKLAGDTYLASHADVENALYCYRQLLELTRREERAPSADDSWLLVALKQDASLTEWR